MALRIPILGVSLSFGALLVDHKWPSHKPRASTR